jgi:hypothetical protein
MTLREQDRERTGERFREQDRVRGELELWSETLDELHVPERFAREWDDFGAHRRGRGTHEIVEERTRAIEARQEHDAAHLSR